MYWRAQLRVSVIRGSRVRAVSSRVTVGEDESVSVEPLGVLGREVHVSGPEDVSSRSHALRVSMVRHHLLGGLTMGAPGCPELAYRSV